MASNDSSRFIRTNEVGQIISLSRALSLAPALPLDNAYPWPTTKPHLLNEKSAKNKTKHGTRRRPNLAFRSCEKVNAHGLAALARGLKNLTELDVGGCERVDDSALRALCSMNAHFLNLSGCSSITEAGVAGIAMNCTALSSLNVTGCPGIGRRFMAELCHSMKLSEPAQAYFGFQVLSRLAFALACICPRIVDLTGGSRGRAGALRLSGVEEHSLTLVPALG